ncbi:alpha/beta hydrolase [Paracidobacterium acidisoli]|uniref:Alpha/beta hydrolase n=1 Tax=Paracidobacterium acidisoli TaxID=2303751 RepID=A0A372IM71_9BACT|nr:alpha/beta hydrolase [Paracidobacterium acidisoli]MBT9332454.1 alpha/beta hydrolase [Paracidobacterium acidisoli]
MKRYSKAARFLLAALLAVSLMPFTRAFARSAPQEATAGTPRAIYLWPNGAPGALGDTEVDKPRMYVFLPAKRSTSAAILVIPGGGYAHVAIGHEGFQIAQWLNAQGMAAFVLDYRVAPYHYPVEINDGRRAMRLIRAHAAEYGVDPNRLGVWGFSAGGHLASSLGTHCEEKNVTATDTTDAESCKPNFMVLSYPVISMELPEAHAGSRMNLLGPDVDPKLEHEYSNQFAVTAQTPPTFLFATTKDPTVPVENSLDFYRALERAGVPSELHIYDYSNHGCGLCGSIIPLSTWPLLLRNWLMGQAMLPPDAAPMPQPQPNFPSWVPGLHGPGEVTPK